MRLEKIQSARAFKTVEGIKSATDNSAEAEEIMNLKYTCPNAAYFYGKLLEEVTN